MLLMLKPLMLLMLKPPHALNVKASHALNVKAGLSRIINTNNGLTTWVKKLFR